MSLNFWTVRSRHSQMFFKIDVVKNFAKFIDITRLSLITDLCGKWWMFPTWSKILISDGGSFSIISHLSCSWIMLLYSSNNPLFLLNLLHREPKSYFLPIKIIITAYSLKGKLTLSCDTFSFNVMFSFWKLLESKQSLSKSAFASFKSNHTLFKSCFKQYLCH